MRWALTEEHRMVQESLRSWLEATATSEKVRAWLAADNDQEFDAALAQEGWSAVGFAELVGGNGGGVLEQALIAEELARVAAPSAHWLATAVAGHALGQLASSVLTGPSWATLAVPADQIPHSAPITVDYHNGQLTGTVSSVLAGQGSEFLVVPGGIEQPRLFLIEAKAAGVSIHPHRLLDASRSVADISFDGVEATPLDLDYLEHMQVASAVAAVLVAADSLGALNRMLDMTVEYSKQREQFGSPIGAFQAVKHEAAQMLVAVESGRTGIYFAAESIQLGHEDWPMSAAIMKAQVCPSAVAGADSALRLHGAIGYTWEYDLQLLYKRAKLNAVLFGSARSWNDQIADQLQLV